MGTRCSRAALLVRPIAVGALALFVVAGTFAVAEAQGFSNQRSVGGISINAGGLVSNATLDELNRLGRLRSQVLAGIPDELAGATEIRKISLRQLEAAIQKHNAQGKPLPDEIHCLAGLQRIQYVFVYPEQHDIVLAGPAEGWQVDERGNVVGVTTGRPVMRLDDLLVALRTARQAANGGIDCSIDPTAEGLLRLRQHASRLRTIGNPATTAAGIERALGVQQISVHGVPETSRFARVLVAADYRMKRLAMAFDKAPIHGLPSYLQMVHAGGRGMNNMLPRWWLEPNYEPLLRSEDGLAWQLRGGTVKAMTEEDFLTAAGTREHTGQASPTAQRWADNMTEKYEELALAEPIFGELRNCMELAVVGALVVKERLTERAGYSMPTLMNPADVKVAEYPAPKTLDSKASVMKKGRNWIISASGGVQVNSWGIADNVQKSNAPVAAYKKVSSGRQSNWWWN